MTAVDDPRSFGVLRSAFLIREAPSFREAVDSRPPAAYNSTDK